MNSQPLGKSTSKCLPKIEFFLCELDHKTRSCFVDIRQQVLFFPSACKSEHLTTKEIFTISCLQQISAFNTYRHRFWRQRSFCIPFCSRICEKLHVNHWSLGPEIWHEARISRIKLVKSFWWNLLSLQEQKSLCEVCDGHDDCGTQSIAADETNVSLANQIIALVKKTCRCNRCWRRKLSRKKNRPVATTGVYANLWARVVARATLIDVEAGASVGAETETHGARAVVRSALVDAQLGTPAVPHRTLVVI